MSWVAPEDSLEDSLTTVKLTSALACFSDLPAKVAVRLSASVCKVIPLRQQNTRKFFRSVSSLKAIVSPASNLLSAGVYLLRKFLLPTAPALALMLAPRVSAENIPVYGSGLRSATQPSGYSTKCICPSGNVHTSASLLLS